MAQPFVGEIRIFAGNFAPNGWMFCDGQLLPISEYETLFTLIGTTYGGNGNEFFALPDMRGRLPLHQGNGFVQGATGGVEEVTLNPTQIPAHSHPFFGTSNAASTTAPSSSVTLGRTSLATITPYGSDSPQISLSPTAVSSVGGSQPHTNMQPYLCVDFIISMYGIYPSPA